MVRHGGNAPPLLVYQTNVLTFLLMTVKIHVGNTVVNNGNGPHPMGEDYSQQGKMVGAAGIEPTWPKKRLCVYGAAPIHTSLHAQIYSVFKDHFLT